MVKTEALISCAVTTQLICIFVFAYAKCWFSRKAAQISANLEEELSHDICHDRKKQVFGLPARSDTNQPVQSQKLARRDQKVEISD